MGRECFSRSLLSANGVNALSPGVFFYLFFFINDAVRKQKCPRLSPSFKMLAISDFSFMRNFECPCMTEQCPHMRIIYSHNRHILCKSDGPQLPKTSAGTFHTKIR